MVLVFQMAIAYIRVTKARLVILVLFLCVMTMLLTSPRTSYFTTSCPGMMTSSGNIVTRLWFGDDVTDRPANLSASTLTPDNASIDTGDDDDDRSRHVRVLVWVMTSPKSLDRAKAVNMTWGRRVHPDILLYFSSVREPTLPTIALKVKEGRNHLTAKTMQAFDYVYQHYLEKADFFMKADDDTYVIMENLRYFLSHQDPNQPFVTGRHFKKWVKQGYPSGGAGYVLSRAALERLANRTRKPPECKEDGSNEDVEIGRCLEKLGVPFLNSSDSTGGSRFHAFTPLQHVVGGLARGYQNWDAYPVRVGPHAINEYPITFHYIKPADMKLLDFYLYRIRPYRVGHRHT